MSNTFTIEVTIITKSNCLIGNQTESFSVGGVDQSTTVDENGRPIIHGSAFKGAFRNIIRENDDNINYMKYTKDYLSMCRRKRIARTFRQYWQRSARYCLCFRTGIYGSFYMHL